MSTEWLIYANGKEKQVSENELLQQIHSGELSINDWAKHPEQTACSRIYTIEGIVDKLLIEYIKNDCCYGPVTGKELGEYYRASKIRKNTPVRVIGQELWHHYSLVCHAKKQEKQLISPIPLPALADTPLMAIPKKWTFSDVMILSLTALSLTVFLTCYFIHH